MSSNEKFEREFESFLKEEDSALAALYRKLPRPEPDAKLDAAVLAMARRAVAAQPRARAPRWLPALSAAAVVALAAGIAFRIGPTVWQEHDTQSLQKPVNESAPTAPVPAAANMEKTQRQKTDEFKDQAAAGSAATSEALNRAAPAPAAAAPPPIGAPAAGYAEPAKPEARLQSRRLEPAPRKVEAPVAQPFPAQATAEKEKKAVETSTVSGGVNDAIQAPTRDDLDAQVLDNKRERTAPAEAPGLKLREAPLSAPTPPPPAREEAAAPPPPAPVEAPATSGIATESTYAAPAPAAKAAHVAPLRSQDPNARLYPEHWLANIRTMLRENKREAALRSLAEFRKMYPDYRLPNDLRDLK